MNVEDVAMAIGRQRLVDLRSMAERVEPNRCWLPDMMLAMAGSGQGRGWVALRADELIWLLDEIERTDDDTEPSGEPTP